MPLQCDLSVESGVGEEGVREGGFRNRRDCDEK